MKKSKRDILFNLTTLRNSILDIVNKELSDDAFHRYILYILTAYKLTKIPFIYKGVNDAAIIRYMQQIEAGLIPIIDSIKEIGIDLNQTEYAVKIYPTSRLGKLYILVVTIEG